MRSKSILMLAVAFSLGVFSGEVQAANLIVTSDMSMYDGYYDEGGGIQDGYTLDMYGGTIIGAFSVSWDAVLNLNGGHIASLHNIHGRLNMFGGSITYFYAGFDEGAYLYGGNVTTMESFDAPIHVYGYDFQYIDNPGPIGINGGYLTGYWEDNTYFSIGCRDEPGSWSTYYDGVVLHEIPEPTTLLLLTLGAVMLRRKR